MIGIAYHYLFYIVLIWFGVLIFAMLLRSIKGPRITDRILCINMIGTMVICCIVLLSRALSESYLVDVALIYAMISFISVLILARTYIPTENRRPRFGRDISDELKVEKDYLKERERAENDR